MRRRATLLFIWLVTVSPAGGAARVPVMVELFTSEGCSSCPPADALLQRLVESSSSGPEIIALGEHVDYWDHQGWKDRFSSAALTGRQRVYGSRFSNESIYTPQMVVDGRSELVGSDAAAARRAIDRAAAAPHGRVLIEIAPALIEREVARPFQDRDRGAESPARRVSVTVSELPAIGRGDHADILLAVTEDHLSSAVKRGENHGKVLTHVAVVRQLTTIGEATASMSSTRTEVTLAPDWQRDHLKIVAFVQERRGRTILASAVTPLKTTRP